MAAMVTDVVMRHLPRIFGIRLHLQHSNSIFALHFEWQYPSELDKTPSMKG